MEQEFSQEVVVDIDQTIAGGVVEAHMVHYNDRFKLQMSSDDIKLAGITYTSTLEVPQIKALRLNQEKEFQQVRNWIRRSHDVHMGLVPYAGAQKGVMELHEAGKGTTSYYTVRPKEIRETTTQWLQKYEFSNSSNVVLCDSPQDKLEKIIIDKIIVPRDNLGYRQNGIVLIDDNYEKLLQAGVELVRMYPEISEIMNLITIVGFGVSQEKLEEKIAAIPLVGIQTMALSSWENREQLSQIKDKVAGRDNKRRIKNI